MPVGDATSAGIGGKTAVFGAVSTAGDASLAVDSEKEERSKGERAQGERGNEERAKTTDGGGRAHMEVQGRGAAAPAAGDADAKGARRPTSLKRRRNSNEWR
jgi:hypothetical protein